MGISMASSLKTVILKTQNELYQISDQWHQLQAMAKRTTVFQSWEWCYSWWEAFSGHYERLATVCVYDNEELAMILPLVVEKYGQGQSRFLLLGHEVSDYLDCLVKSGYETRLGHVLLKVMKQQGISQLRTGDVPPWASLYQAITELRFSKDVRVTEWRDWIDACPYIVLPSTWEAYLSSRSGKHRRNIGRTLRRIDEAGLTLGYCDQPDHALTREAVKLHCQRMESRGLKTIFKEPSGQHFLELAFDRLLRANKARIFTLKDGNILASFGFILRDKSWFYCYIPGQNSHYLKLSPGTAVLAEIVRVAIADDMYGVDLMRGAEVYKDKWATAEITPLVVDIEHLGFAQKMQRRLRLRTRAKLVKDFCLNHLRRHHE
jgi:CelD/BcsL family acetyltransferase involved in cellulose biosynthesis